LKNNLFKKLLFLKEAVTKNVIAIFTSQFEIKKTIGNSAHNFYKKCDTNITLKL